MCLEKGNSVEDEGQSSMSGETKIGLEGVLDISVANELHQQLKTALNEAKPVVLEAAQLERIDTAALQCLTIFFRDAQQDGINVEWRSPADCLLRAAETLGLSAHLHLAN